MGDDQTWERDDFGWDLLRDVLLGQASRLFFVGAMASSGLNALFKREMPRANQLIPAEGAITLLANVMVTAHDIATLDEEKLHRDLERVVKSLAVTRVPYNIYRRLTGDSDSDRRRVRERRARGR